MLFHAVTGIYDNAKHSLLVYAVSHTYTMTQNSIIPCCAYPEVALAPSARRSSQRDKGLHSIIMSSRPARYIIPSFVYCRRWDGLLPQLLMLYPDVICPAGHPYTLLNT